MQHDANGLNEDWLNLEILQKKKTQAQKIDQNILEDWWKNGSS